MSDRSDLSGGPLCPVPVAGDDKVRMAHGGGGRMSQRLIEDVFLAAFSNPILDGLHDGAILEVNGSRLAFTTDSFVVRPRFFPGGDIGSLSVHGTVNDLAMCGARPLALSAGFILEEGLPVEELKRLVGSMRDAAARVPVDLVTGDTKVVDRGKGDGVFINTSGIGVVEPGIDVAPDRACPGDVVIVSGTIADHGMAILAAREGLGLGSSLTSDAASLWGMVSRVLPVAGAQLHVMRDPTRGGVASALNEIAAAAGVGMDLDEKALPVRDEVRGACELLGMDPLYVANEGKCLLVVAEEVAGRVLEILHGHPLGRDAVVLGRVTGEMPGTVWLRSRIGGRRRVDMISGEQLPRIC
jgi:hydrogenase expression/formation protein HypE